MHLRIQGFASTRQFVIFNGLSLDAYQSVSPQGQHSISLLNEPRRNVLILSLFIETLFTPVSSLPGIVFMPVFSKDFMDMIQCVNILRIVETIVTDHSEMFLRNMNNQFIDQRSS